MDLFEERTISVYEVRTGPVPGFKNAKYKGRTDPAVIARMNAITEMLAFLKTAAITTDLGFIKKRTKKPEFLDRWSRLHRIRIDDRGLLTIRVVFYLSDRKTRDADNMMSTVLDCLKKAGIIKDDSINHIGEQSYTHRRVKKGWEGFRATIIT